MAMMPEHVRARLDARNRPKEPRTPGREPPPKAPGTPGRSLPPKAPGTPSKEPPTSRGAAQQQHLAPSPGGKENGRSYASPSKILTPSKCVLEVERMKRQREQRRQQAEERGDRGSADHETLIAQFRSSLHVPVRTGEESQAADEAQRSPLCVYVRKRPLLGPEIASGQFDLLTPTPTTVTLHEAKRRVDLAKMLEHHAFTFDQVFDEAASTARLRDFSYALLLLLSPESPHPSLDLSSFSFRRSLCTARPSKKRLLRKKLKMLSVVIATKRERLFHRRACSEIEV